MWCNQTKMVQNDRSQDQSIVTVHQSGKANRKEKEHLLYEPAIRMSNFCQLSSS